MTALSFAFFLGGIALGLVDRGKFTTRSGRQVYQELVEEGSDRRARRAGQNTLFSWVNSWGWGWAVKGEANYTHKEVSDAWREGNYRLLLPLVLAVIGAIGIPLFLGLCFTQSNDIGNFFMGCAMVAAAVAFLIAGCLMVRKNLAKLDAEPSRTN